MNKSNRTISIVLLFGMLFASSFLAFSMNITASSENETEPLMLDEQVALYKTSLKSELVRQISDFMDDVYYLLDSTDRIISL